MIAIIRDGGKQYRVEEGQSLFIDRRKSEPGSEIEFGEVLCVERDGNLTLGQPLVDGAKVVAEVVSETKGPKLIIHRFRRRKGSRTRFGHRQKYTQVKIKSIQG